MEKRTMNLFSSFILFIGIMIFTLGLIQSIDLATEIYSYWGETKSEFDFELFLKYFIPAIIRGVLVLSMSVMIDLLFAIKEVLEELPVNTKSKKKKSDEDKPAEKQEILKDLLDNGVITQEEYDAEMLKENKKENDN